MTSRPTGRPDFFISHASEDKESVARPLARELMARGFSVWLDESELRLGDSLRAEIDKGLAVSRFGVVILSQAFFSKQWPQKELNALAARESTDGRKVILPIVHGMSPASVMNYSPLLADRLSVSTERGLGAIADEIIKAAGPSSTRRAQQPNNSGESAATDPMQFAAGRRMASPSVSADASVAVPATDVEPLIARARSAVRAARWRGRKGALIVAVACGPLRELIRPSRLEDPRLANDLQQRAAFGRARVLDPRAATTHRIEGDTLVLQQPASELHVDGSGMVVSLDPTIADAVPVSGAFGGLVVIEEHLREQLVAVLTFAGDLISEIDAGGKVAIVVPIAGMLDPQYIAWRTRAEHTADPNRVNPNMFGPERALAELTPPNRTRGALFGETAELADDLLVLLRRQLRATP